MIDAAEELLTNIRDADEHLDPENEDEVLPDIAKLEQTITDLKSHYWIRRGG
jgi:hypothetical protein